MEFFGVAIFDIVVIGSIAVGGLIGIITGFVRGGLFVLSWIGAVIATFYAYPYVEPVMREYIEPDLLADIVGAGAVFLIGLIALHLVGHIIGERVRKSRLKALDRFLGLLAGLATPTAAICFLYLFLADSLPPEWLLEARTRPLVEQGAKLIGRVLPDELRRQAGDALGRAESGLQSLGAALPAAEPAQPNDGPPPPEAGYDPNERRRLDNFILDRR